MFTVNDRVVQVLPNGISYEGAVMHADDEVFVVVYDDGQLITVHYEDTRLASTFHYA
jgi:hypothetical protein